MSHLRRIRGSASKLISGLILAGGSIFLLAPLQVDAQINPAIATSTAGSAQTPDSASQTEINFANTLEMILRALYLIMWPLLAIAGASLDNSLIYGEIFKLDVSLRQFWQIMRSFANFALGFAFVGSILWSLFTEKSAFNPKEIIRKVIMGAIAIQVSRFCVAVLIDLSTIGIYGVGALPLTIIDINKDNRLNKVAYPVSHTMFDADQASSQSLISSPFSVYYTCPAYPWNSEQEPENVIMVPCWTKNWALIRKWTPEETDSWDGYKENFVKQWNGAIQWKEITVDQISNEHCVRGQDIIEMKPEQDLKTKEDVYALKQPVGEIAATQRQCPTLPLIMKKAVNATGPLFTLYSSILSIANLGFSPDKSGIVEITLEFLIKTIVWLMLLIPLFVLCVVLIIRVVFLWLIIAVSPILVLWYVFNIKMISGGDKTSLGNVVGLIFLPVFVVFAIGISLVFLTLVVKADLIQEKPLDVVSLVGWEDTDCWDNADGYKFLGMFDMCFTRWQKEFGAGITNIFAYLIVNGFAIGLMRAVVFAALKSSKITEGVVSSIQWFATKMAMAVPIVPTPRWAASYSGLKDAKRDVMSIPSAIQTAQYDNQMRDYIESNAAQNSEGKKSMDTEIHAMVSQGGSADNVPAMLKSWAAQSTDYSQYKELPQAVGKRAGTSAQVKNRNDVFSDPTVLEKLQSTKMDDGKSLLEHLDQNRVKYKKWWAKRKEQKWELYTMMKNGMNANTKPELRRQLTAPGSTTPTQYLYWDTTWTYMHAFDERSMTVKRYNFPIEASGSVWGGTDEVIRERLSTLGALINSAGGSDNFSQNTSGKYNTWIEEIIWTNPSGNMPRRTIHGITMSLVYKDKATPGIITNIILDPAAAPAAPAPSTSPAPPKGTQSPPAWTPAQGWGPVPPATGSTPPANRPWQQPRRR